MIIRKGCPAIFVDVGKVSFIKLNILIEVSIVIITLLRIGNTNMRIRRGNNIADKMKGFPEQ